MPSSHLSLCHPFLLLPSIPPSIRVFSNESAFRMRWPKYWSFSFSISPSNEHPGLISFRMDWWISMWRWFNHQVMFDSCLTPQTVAHQAPLSMGFSRQEQWSGLSCPSPGDCPKPGIKPGSAQLAGGFFTAEPSGVAVLIYLSPIKRCKEENWTQGHINRACCPSGYVLRSQTT